MKTMKVVSVNGDGITFDNGSSLSSDHQSDCCEHHELTFSDLTLADFEGLEFDLNGDDFFRKIEDFGIELVPINGHSVKIPGHGWNNGCYGTNLTLVISGGGLDKTYDITECQVIND